MKLHGPLSPIGSGGKGRKKRNVASWIPSKLKIKRENEESLCYGLGVVVVVSKAFGVRTLLHAE